MANNENRNIKLISYIEDKMNRILLRVHSLAKVDFYGTGDGIDVKTVTNEMEATMKDLPKIRADLVMVDEHMKKRGYVRENGSLDYARFRLDGCIDQSVWSRYECSDQSRTSHDTLLKILLALRLNESEARYYLSMAGSGFAITDKVDMIILSYIMLDYLGDIKTVDIVSSVSFLLDYYSEQEVKAGRRELRKLYKI